MLIATATLLSASANGKLNFENIGFALKEYINEGTDTGVRTFILTTLCSIQKNVGTRSVPTFLPQKLGKFLSPNF